MNELRRQENRFISQRDENQDYCDYCGTPLSAFFYFCVGCGTPYKDINSITAPAFPPVMTEGDLVRLKAPSAAPLFWTYFSVIVFGSIFAQVFFKKDRPDLVLFFLSGAIFLTTIIFSTLYWRSLVMQFKRLGFDRLEGWLALLILAPMLAVNYLYSMVLMKALQVPSASPFEELRETGMSEATLVIAICLLPAITEEIAFRGLLQHWLQLAIHPHRAIAVSAFLFAALHFTILSLPYLFGLGVLLGWAKWKSGSLYPSMFIHFLHNLIVIEFFFG